MSAKKKLIGIRSAFYRATMRAVGALFPVDQHKTVYISFGGHAYSDNPRAVSEAMSALDPKARPIWLFKDPDKARPSMPEDVTALRIHSLRAIWAMATAGCWVLNGLMPPYVIKRKGQLYVQTWHGDRGFKVCLQESGKNGLPDAKVLDVGVIGSDLGEMFFHTAFQYDGELLRVGSPRNDALIHIDPAEAARIRRDLGIAPDEGVAMYAPTMRENLGHTSKKQDLGALDFVRILNLLEDKDQRKWRLIVRAHSTMAGLTGYAQDARILDLSDYEDMRDLLIITDLYMTDYSSSACDFPLANRPVAIYQPDYDAFKSKDRTLYFDIEDSPFPTARTQEELEAILSQMNEASTRESCRKILDFYVTDESGEASRRVADWMIAHRTPLESHKTP